MGCAGHSNTQPFNRRLSEIHWHVSGLVSDGRKDVGDQEGNPEKWGRDHHSGPGRKATEEREIVHLRTEI